MLSVLLIAGGASEGFAAKRNKKATVRVEQLIAQKIKSFKPGSRQSEARHFDFENYSFATLDDAAERLFPAGTKMSYVDKVLKGRGKAKKSAEAQDSVVRYNQYFRFDRFACTRTVFVKFDSKTKRVVSARGDGYCT